MKSFDKTPISAVKNYWNARPCNIRHSTKEIGTREYFDEVEHRKYFVEPHIPGFAEFEQWNGKRVLEIGCGLGTDTINFARNGAIVTAVDLSESSLALASKRAKVFGLENSITFYQANAEELSSVVPVEPYDLIYSFGVLHHTPHPERAIEQIKEFTKEGSTFKMMVYHKHSFKVGWILASYGKGQFWKLDELVAKHSEAQTGCPVTYTYTKDEGKKLLQDKGFEVISADVEHIFPYKIEEYKKYQYEKVWYFKHMPDDVFKKLENTLGWHLCLTAKI